ncbi:MAG: GGDEF domain-containing protein [Sphingomicrobium sp.]
MEDVLSGAERSALNGEIERLRGEVARLGERIEDLDRVAHMDPLVPIANRRGLIRQLEISIARRARHKTPSALLFVDVDGLKMLNDSYGHGAGDAALVYIAEAMVRAVRRTDLVARLGGDEFAILLDHAGEANARDTAERLTNEVAGADFVHNGRALPLSIAIGFTMVAGDDDPEAVLDRADQAMYRDKAAA